MIEKNQGHETRKYIIEKIEKQIKRPLITFFTSFRFPVMIEDADADMLEGIIQKMDRKNGLAILISSPGGLGLAAERIINMGEDHWRIFTVGAPGLDAILNTELLSKNEVAEKYKINYHR